MEFLHPASLWLLLLGAVPIVLYLVRRRSKKVRVSTLVFFKTLAQEHQESAWLRRLKRWISLLLTLLVLSLAVLVLSGLVVRQDDADRHRTIVVLLDRSASMSVRDDSGESRIEAAKRVLRERLTKVPEEVGIALIVYDERPEVLQPRTLKRRELLSRLEDVDARPVPGRPDAALEAARMIAGLEPPSAIWHLGARLIGQPVEGAELHELNLAKPEVANVGITA
ncbi:MAG TPA: VWA domain-containing protein, partial [Bacteroidia bacterium]|nr:VWA domain-containing protein [Bacteroidia bacterium]